MIEVSELRTLSPQELKGKLKQWREELFRTRFKSHQGEARDTSVMKKLRKEIARVLTLLTEKEKGISVAKPVEKTVVQSVAVESAPKKRAGKKKE